MEVAWFPLKTQYDVLWCAKFLHESHEAMRYSCRYGLWEAPSSQYILSSISVSGPISVVMTVNGAQHRFLSLVRMFVGFNQGPMNHP